MGNTLANAEWSERMGLSQRFFGKTVTLSKNCGGKSSLKDQDEAYARDVSFKCSTEKSRQKHQAQIA